MKSGQGLDNRLSPEKLIGELQSLKYHVVEKTKEGLAGRGVKPRSAADTEIFTPFNTVLAILLGSGHYLERVGLDVYGEIEQEVLEFEARNNTELHKGAIYFNAGILHLSAGNFDRALYYWIKAENEDIALGHRTQDILRSEIFQKNFWRNVKGFVEGELAHENRLLNVFTGADFEFQKLEQQLNAMDHHDLVGFLINLFRRFSYESLESNKASHLLYYQLVGGYAFIFEASLKGHLARRGIQHQQTLGAILRNDLGRARVGDISAVAAGISRAYPCGNTPDYNLVLPRLLFDIDGENNSLALMTKVLHLVTITRNQVAHDIDTTNRIYSDIPMCQRLIRLMLGAHLFDEYL
ncbi:MAG: hypothetical protein HRF44_00230 [Ignavibacterium sp.]|jgi:hypothetical protein